MKYSELYRALRMKKQIMKYLRNEEGDLIDIRNGEPMQNPKGGDGLYAEAEGEEDCPFFTTEGERNYIAQMLCLPEAKVFLVKEDYDKLLKHYGFQPDNPIRIVGEARKREQSAEIDKMRKALVIVKRKLDQGLVYAYKESELSVQEMELMVKKCLDSCFYYENNRRNGCRIKGIGYPIGIEVDVRTHTWYLDFYCIYCEDESVRVPDRVHARISRMEEMCQFDEFLNHMTNMNDGVQVPVKCHNRQCGASGMEQSGEDQSNGDENQSKYYQAIYEHLKIELKQHIKNYNKSIYGLDDLMELYVYGDEGNKVTTYGKRPYKLYVYVRNYYGALERAAAVFSCYKRKIVREETSVFTGRLETVLCFHIYYFEWEREYLLKAVIGLGKNAYVKKLQKDDFLTDDELKRKLDNPGMEKFQRAKEEYEKKKALEIKESEEFVMRLLEIIHRGKKAYS